MLQAPKRHEVFLRHGYRPPEWLMRKIKRRHPTVSLLWERNLKRYALVQTDIPGQPHLITVLKEPPNIENTVRFLDKHHPTHLSNKFKMEKFLHEVDGSGPDEGQYQDRMGEGTDRLWRAMNPKVVVQKR